MRRTTASNGGSSAARRFREAYDTYASDVAAYALRRLPAEDAADVVAETFVVVWRRIDEMPEEPSTRTWLLRVTRRVANAQAEGKQREDRLAERLAEQFQDRFGDLPPIDRLEQLSLVGAAIKRLSEDDRELLLLVAWDDLQPAEIGTLLGLPGPVVRKRLHRARTRLRRHLADLDGSWRTTSASDRSTPPMQLRPTTGGTR